MLKAIAVSGLEKTINQVLKLDPSYKALLKPLVDKTIKLTINFPQITLYVQMTEESVQCLHYYGAEPDCTLQGSSVAFLQLALSKESTKDFFSSQVTVTGSTDTAQQFARLCKDLDLDWEECLAKYSGDTVAHTTGNFMRNMMSWCMKTTSTLTKNVSEFVHHEINVFPQRDEIDAYLNNVDNLRNDSERLNARFQRLQSTIAQQET